MAKILSAFILVLAVILTVGSFKVGENETRWGFYLSFIVIDLAVIICYLYASRSYEIKDSQLIIKRLINNKTYDLSELHLAKRYSDVKSGMSVRSFGNGGVFGYWGWYYNRGFGKYFMHATSMKNLIILDFVDHKIGISPDDEAFVRELEKHTNSTSSS